MAVVSKTCRFGAIVQMAPQLPQAAASSGFGAEQLEQIIEPSSYSRPATSRHTRDRALRAARALDPPAVHFCLAVLELPLPGELAGEALFDALVGRRSDLDAAR